jgi:uncharacterized membrane protein YoaK (UPF0700 family)
VGLEASIEGVRTKGKCQSMNVTLYIGMAFAMVVGIVAAIVFSRRARRKRGPHAKHQLLILSNRWIYSDHTE